MDIPRPGPPPSDTDAQIIRILEIACRNPSDYGYEFSQWSLNQLVAATIKEGIVDSISAKTISRFFKYGENPPASRPLLAAFLRESDHPESFTEKVNEICSVYQEAPAAREAGRHTVSVDEMTGVQALIETAPKAFWVFVCDGLNTHKSESLVKFVAEQCGIQEPLGRKRKEGILKSFGKPCRIPS